MVSSRRVVPVLLVMLMLVLNVSTTRVVAAAESCGAFLSVNSLAPDTSSGNYLQINNDGTDDIAWIRVTRSSANFTITDANGGDWTASYADDQATFSGTVLAAGDIYNHILLQIQAGSSEVAAEPWTVEASTSPTGDSPFTCSNYGLEMSINAGLPPVASNIQIVVYARSVIVSWQTDKPSNNQVHYGLSDGYGLTTTYNSSFTQNHTVTIDGLEPETGYHYSILTQDSFGNTALTSDSTFLTAAEAQNTSSGSSTSGQSSGQSSSNQRPSETTPPTITTTAAEGVFGDAPKISGKATDNVALAKIEYSTDNGANWLPVDEAPNLGGLASDYAFTPQNLDDGDYLIVVRAVDTSSNAALTQPVKIVIDRLPPVVGGQVMYMGNDVLSLDVSGQYVGMRGSDYHISLTAVGGPTAISISARRTGGQSKTQTFNLTKNPQTAIWSGVASFIESGDYTLVVEARDGAGNIYSDQLATIRISEAGRITDGDDAVDGARLTVYNQNPDDNSWVLWDAAAYSQTNPIFTDSDGSYSLSLPAGDYYIKVTAPGYKDAISNIFHVDDSQIISANVQIHKKLGFSLGGVHVRLPWLSWRPTITVADSHSRAVTADLDSPVPNFNLARTNGSKVSSISILGKPTVLSVVSTWAPSARQQIGELSKLPTEQINVLAVSSGESLAKLSAYASLANFTTGFVADTGNQLIKQLPSGVMPTTYFINRQGVVKSMSSTVLSEEEIINNVPF